MPAGLCFREDNHVVTNNNSEFVPHFVVSNTNESRKFNFKITKLHKQIRELLYGEAINKRIY